MRTKRFATLTLLTWPLLMNGSGAPVWQKPVREWTREDAVEVLRHSPWSREMTPVLLPLQNENERRESGGMGLQRGIGYDGIGDDRPRVALPDSMFGKSSATPVARPIAPVRLRIRWESALPIQAAELKAGMDGVSYAPGEVYVVAVYGIPGTYFGDPEKLGTKLKGLARMEWAGGAVTKPEKVEVYQREDGALAVYTFPRGLETEERGDRVSLSIQIGRLVIAESFLLGDMRIDGRPAL